MAETKTLFINDLTLDPQFQARSRINSHVVKDYEERIIAGASMPPIKVVKTGKEQIVVDGFHRLNAYQNQGRDRITAEVYEGDRGTALRLAVSANQTHGLQRSRDDKIRAVELALNDFELSCESDRALGKLCGVSHTFVASVREQLGKEKSQSKFSRKQDSRQNLEVESTPPPALADDESFRPAEELIDLLISENEQLKDRLAIGFMEGSSEEKAQTESLIAELRDELRVTKKELEAVKISRNTFQNECHQMRNQINWLQMRIKRLNDQLGKQGQEDEDPPPF